MNDEQSLLNIYHKMISSNEIEKNKSQEKLVLELEALKQKVERTEELKQTTTRRLFYRLLSTKTDYPLHLGVTESGSFVPGSVKTSIGLGSLLMEGIGDTIRVSLSDDPIKEVKIGNEILKSLNLRNRGVRVISCPSCARQGFEVIDVVKKLEEKLSHIKTPLTLSIIGCVVNGPGEAALTDIGITGGGKGSNMFYLSGIQTEKVLTNEIINKVVEEVEKKVSQIKSK